MPARSCVAIERRRDAVQEAPVSARRDPQPGDRTGQQAHQRGGGAAGERQRRRSRGQPIDGDGGREPQQQAAQRGQAQRAESGSDVGASVAADAPVEQRADQHQHRRREQREHDRRHLPSPVVTRCAERLRIHPGFRQRLSSRERAAPRRPAAPDRRRLRTASAATPSRGSSAGCSRSASAWWPQARATARARSRPRRGAPRRWWRSAGGGRAAARAATA